MTIKYNNKKGFILKHKRKCTMAILPIDDGRYGTKEMKAIFDVQNKIDCQVQIESAVATAQANIGMIPKNAAVAIKKASAKPGSITAKRVMQLEAKRDHDTAALVEALGQKCTESARPWIHYGLTSNDLVDTSNSMQIRDAICIIQPKVAKMALTLANMSSKYSSIPAVGRTHGQHASIISFGLKFANWAAEMASHIDRINEIKSRVLICKTLGVVGTGSLMGKKAPGIQRQVSKMLRLYPATVATQIVPRERYAEYVFEMALLGATLEKMAVEIRNLQRTEIGEVAESFKQGQMGSSAVPVKRNPIKSERITSLARILKSQVIIAIDNIPLWHERDLSNSANERFVIPTASILVDEMLHTMQKIISNLYVNTKRIQENLNITNGQIFAEFVLEAMIKKDIPRIKAYEDVQRVAFEANKSRVAYADAIKSDKSISGILTAKEIDAIFDPSKRMGASDQIIKDVVSMVNKKVKTGVF